MGNVTLISQSLRAISMGLKKFMPTEKTRCSKHPDSYFYARLYSPVCVSCMADYNNRYRSKNTGRSKDKVISLDKNNIILSNKAILSDSGLFMPSKGNECKRHKNSPFIAIRNRCYECYLLLYGVRKSKYHEEYLRFQKAK